MAKALYRKYRPKTLNEVMGQEQVTKVLERALAQRRISHAYLFVGPRGTGKTSVARIFAHEINGFPYQIEDDYVDIVEIDGASNRGIDDIRELREKAAIAPSEGKFKVYIIDEVHMLTTPAFNALLKTLEEPPEHVIFMMATTDVHKVPKTILSRAQNFTFKLADPEMMQNFLRKIADEEGIKIDDDALRIVVRQGGGSFRDSLSVLDQVATLSDSEITRDLVVAAMGLPEEEEVEQILESYSRRELGEISDTLMKVLGAGIKPELLVEGLIRRILAEPRPEWLGLLERLPNVTAPFPDAKLLVALTAECARPTGGQMTIKASKPSDEMRNKNQAEPKNEVKEEIQAEPKTKPVQNSTVAIDWGEFVKKVHAANDTVGRQLEKVKFLIKADALHLYPEKKVTKAILTSSNNLRMLREMAGEREVIVHEIDDEAGAIANDPNDYVGTEGIDSENNTMNEKKQKLDKISEALGGKVVEDGTEVPF